MRAAFETVHTTFDRLEAEMVAEVLVGEGIDARLIGTTNAALIGASPHILRLRIEVPRDAAAQAREVVAGILEADPTAAAAAATAEVAPGDEEAATSPRPRNPLVAVGAAFVLPGGSHVYARHPWSGLMLAAAFLLTLIVMIAGARRHVIVAAGALTLGALLLADLLAGQLAVRRANRGVHATRARQLARGLILAGAAALVGTLAGSAVPPPPPTRPPWLPRPLYLQPRPRETPIDQPLLPADLDFMLRRRGAASQPASTLPR